MAIRMFKYIAFSTLLIGSQILPVYAAPVEVESEDIEAENSDSLSASTNQLPLKELRNFTDRKSVV